MEKSGPSTAFALSIALLLISSWPTRADSSCQLKSIGDGWRKLEHNRNSSKYNYTNIRRAKGTEHIAVYKSAKSIRLSSSRKIESHVEGELGSTLRSCGLELSGNADRTSIDISINEVSALDIFSCGAWIPHYESCVGIGCKTSSFNREGFPNMTKPNLDFALEKDCAVHAKSNAPTKGNETIVFGLNANVAHGELISFGCFLPARSSNSTYNKLFIRCISSLLYLISDEECISKFDMHFSSQMNIGAGEPLCQ